MTQQNSKSIMLFRLWRPLIHMLFIAIIYRLAYQRRINSTLFWKIDIGTTRVAGGELIVYSIISAGVFVVTGIIHKWYNLLSTESETNRTFLTVWWQWTIIMTCLAYFGQEFLFQHGISRFVIIVVALTSLVIIPLVEYIWKSTYKKRVQQFPHTVRILLQDHTQQPILTKLVFPNYYQVRISLFEEIVHSTIDEESIILVGSYRKDQLQELIDLMRLENKQIYHLGDNHFLEDVIYGQTKFAGLLMLRYTSSQIEGWAAISKRIFDIIGASLGLILTSPLMILAAIAIKRDSKGPVFYRQERVGKNGKHFIFTKFRSMYTHLSVGKDYGGETAQALYQDLVNSHANIRQGELPKIQDDPRVTRVGKRLRASSIDELPNLFAVLTGDMSLIGPRPHLPSEIANYKPWQRRVLSIKPGITGYAQIHGRDTLTFDQEAMKELEYIQNWSLWLDIYIIIRTFGVLFIGRGK